VGEFAAEMRKILSAGKDILCINFSSALSTTYHPPPSPRRTWPRSSRPKVLVVDSLCASLGQGLLVYLCAQSGARAALWRGPRLRRGRPRGRSATGSRGMTSTTSMGAAGSAPATGPLRHHASIKPFMHVDRRRPPGPVSKARWPQVPPCWPFGPDGGHRHRPGQVRPCSSPLATARATPCSWRGDHPPLRHPGHSPQLRGPRDRQHTPAPVPGALFFLGTNR
jgi:hypothetical protein